MLLLVAACGGGQDTTPEAIIADSLVHPDGTECSNLAQSSNVTVAEQRAVIFRDRMFSEIETWYAARLTELVAPPTRREILEELTESTVALDAEAEMVFVSVAITQLDASADIVAALQVARVGGENTRAAWVGVDARCEVG